MNKDIELQINDIEGIDLSLDVSVKKIEPPLDNLEVTPTKEQQNFNHEGSYGYDNVIVQAIPDEYIIPEGVLPITENTTYDVTKYARVSASVHPAPYLQDKEIVITNNGTQDITYDEEYDGLNKVTITTNVQSTSGKTTLNILTQDEEPETYNGIWVKDNNIAVTGVDFASEFSIFNSWSYDTSVSIPNAIREATNVSVGTDIYVIGGTINNAASNSMFKYDTVNKTIKSLTSLPYNAYGVAAAAVGTDIYIFGGRDGSNGLNKAYRYDTLTDTYTQLANMPYYSGQFSCVLYHNDIYMFGGHHNGSQLYYAYKYSIENNRYSALRNMPYVVNALTTVVCRDKIYLIGGNNGGAKNYIYTYNVDTNNYTRVGTLPQAIWGQASFVLSPYIVLVGGFDGLNSGDYSDKIYIYNTITNKTITSSNTLPEKLGRLSGSFVNGYFYIIGAHINDLASSRDLSKICYSPIYLDISEREVSNNTLLLVCDNKGIETSLSSDGGMNITTKVCGGYYFSNDTILHNIEVYCGTGTKWELL